MKKILLSIMAIAMTALSLTSCEDVPMPYDYPGTGTGDDSGSTAIVPVGDGTAASPFNVAAAIEKCKEVGTTATTEFYYVRGTIKSIDDSGVAQYGNVNIDMIDEGGKDVFKAFQILYINNAKFTDATASSLNVGDVIVVKGQLVNYQGNTPETNGKGSACIVSVNGVGDGGTPDVTVDPKGNGTAADPFNVAAAIAKCAATGETATTEIYYVEGIAQNIDASGAGQYGNITIDMVDEGASAAFKAFQIVSFNGAKFTEASVASTVKVGDKIVVKGNLVNYKGNTPETTGKGAAQLVSVNGAGGGTTPDTPTTGEAKGDGSKENPYNAVAANELAKSLASGATSQPVYIKGKVSRTKDISVQYKNATFYISEDGKQNDEFYVFRCKGLNNADIASANDVMVGDDVVIYGPVTNYQGNTPETVQNEAYIYSIVHNGTPGGSDSGNAGSGGEVSENSITVTPASLGIENGVEVGTLTLSDGTTLAFNSGGNTNAPKYYNSGTNIRMYPKNFVTVTAKKKIASIFFDCDTYNGILCNADGQVTASNGKVSISGSSILFNEVGNTTTTITNSNTATGTASQVRITRIVINYAE